MLEVTRTNVRMHAFALAHFFAERHIDVEIWPQKKRVILGLVEADSAPFRIMVADGQLGAAQALLAAADGDLAIRDGGPAAGARQDAAEAAAAEASAAAAPAPTPIEEPSAPSADEGTARGDATEPDDEAWSVADAPPDQGALPSAPSAPSAPEPPGGFT